MLLPATAGAQASPIGPQFEVNGYATGDQSRPTVAVDAQGRFVVVWNSYGSAGTDTSEYSAQGRRFAADGTPLGGDFQINQFTTGQQWNPVVDSDDAGGFVVAWYSGSSSGPDTYYSVQARRYDAAGSPLGPEFQANTFTSSLQGGPDVAVDADGDFVLSWWSYGSTGTDSSDSSVQARRYDPSGNPLGPEMQVNTYTTSYQDIPAIASEPGGDFVVVWTSFGSSGSDGSYNSIQGRRFTASGVPLGAEFQVNTYTTGFQYAPDVARDAVGNFLVVWRSSGSSGSDSDGTSIQARLYDASGSPLGPDFQVNSETSGAQAAPAVAADPQGTFVVVWKGYDATATYNRIKGRRYRPDGSPIGDEFQVDSLSAASPDAPAVATDPDGNFLVAWQSLGSAGPDSSGTSIQARRFDALFRDGFESGDASRWSAQIP